MGVLKHIIYAHSPFLVKKYFMKSLPDSHKRDWSYPRVYRQAFLYLISKQQSLISKNRGR